MAAGDPSAAATGDTPAAPYRARLREALADLSQACDIGDSHASEAASFTVSDILVSVATVDAVSAEADGVSDNGDPAASAIVCEELLREVHQLLLHPSSNQMLIDALSLVLPNPVAKLGAQKGGCQDVASAILKFFVMNCSPRDMLSILCEALDASMELPTSTSSFVLLLNALAEVLTLIQRRHIEQVKVALPAVLKVMHATVSEYDEEHGNAAVDIFNAAHEIGNAINEMGKAMVNKNKDDLFAILGLYSLQNIALISRSEHDILSACRSVVLQHFRFLKSSGFTYLGLLTGSDVIGAMDKLSKEEDADFVEYFSFAMDGAALSVLWTYMFDDISKFAGEDLELALKEVQGNHMKKWEAINMLKFVLSSISYPWTIKSHGINLLLSLAGENAVEEIINNPVDFTSYAPCTFATLKAIENVMMTAPEALLRKNAFAALKKVISLVPSSQRFDILQALVNNSISPSLTAVLLDIVREEVLRESRRADNDCIEHDGFGCNGELPPWASCALELVELILRPPEGGHPCLPDHSEQVISALNLLRFILIIDSRGPSSGKLFQKETLHKVRSEWLIPLRPIVARIQSENERDDSDIAIQIVCSLNPVQLVLHRCIELVEQKMRNC